MAEKKPEPTEQAETNALTRIQTSANRGVVLTSLEDMRDFAQILLQSKLVPDSFKTKEQICVALQAGAELGLKPMQSLRSIYVVRSKPTLWGDAALALVKKSGLMAEFSEGVTGDGDKMVATVRSVCKGAAGITTVISTFSVTDAKTANLWKKAGPWTTHPKRMLKYKARAFNLRDNFPDVLEGMHLKEEMEGEEALPKPECDTPPRDGRRRKVESKISGVGSEISGVESNGVRGERANMAVTGLPLSPQKVESQEVAGTDTEPVVAETDESADTATGLFDEVFGLYNKLGGQDFTAFAAEILCRGEDEVDVPEKFTEDMLIQVKQHIVDEGV